jgi:hypothetical protein
LAGGALLLAMFVVPIKIAAASDVIVLANRTRGPLAIKVFPAAGPVMPLSLPADDVRPLYTTGPAQVEFVVPGETKRYQLDANSAYFFGRDASGRIDLQKIGLDDDAAAQLRRTRIVDRGGAAQATITVKILVDDEEPARQFNWEQRLRRRIEAASEILQLHCRVRLQVVATGAWDSDDATSDFLLSLGEFEKESQPSPARVAIGFTSQFAMLRGRVHMAGTRGPLHSHILIREGSPQIDEAERLEFLVHELGHFLGAAHSPERASVMRPILGDNLAGRSDFHIRFDPVNTLVIAMIGEEMRSGNVSRFTDLSTDTKRQLQSIYGALSRALPSDQAGERFMRLAEAATNEPLVRGAKRVLQGIVGTATANRALPPAAERAEGQKARLAGDALCNHLVREAAALADTLPDDIAPQALLVALAIGLDDSDTLLKLPNTRMLAQAIESPPDRATRWTVLGEPTLLGRRDLVGRFFVAAYLSSTIGSDAANEACLAQEMRNLRVGSFSFAQVAADRAGIRWGDGIRSGRFTPPNIATGFNGSVLMPSVEKLPDALLPAQFAARFGGPEDSRFRDQLHLIDLRINHLPVYGAR